jgi:hypothetical protein
MIWSIMKRGPEYVEGPEAWTRFNSATKQASVTHAEIQKRIEAHRAEAAKNQTRRGPKPEKHSA